MQSVLYDCHPLVCMCDLYADLGSLNAGFLVICEHEMWVTGSNACNNNNGGCSHVCTPSGHSVECSCPSDVGLVLQNGGKMCVSAYNNCTAASTFTCRSGQCIHSMLACDGRNDCDDGSVVIELC